LLNRSGIEFCRWPEIFRQRWRRSPLPIRTSLEYFRDAVFNYPTLAEAYKVAALDGLNRIS
jgi:hypothetical protein